MEDLGGGLVNQSDGGGLVLQPLKFSSEFTPEKWWQRKTSRPTYWVPVTFQGRAVKRREGILCGL